MNRKVFLRGLVSTGIASFISTKGWSFNNDIADFSTVPSYLKIGDTVGITCPAGHVDLLKIQPCIDALKRWGLNVKLGKTVGSQWQRFGGTDEERLQDFQSMIDDENVSAIIFGKGGYGSMRIIDKINWDKFRQKPKWLVGYSDLTIVHSHIHANMHIPTIHGDMCTGFSVDPTDLSAVTLQQALFGEKIEYKVNGFSNNRKGEASGILIGGNLSLLHAATGSKSDISTKGKILFIEDVSEYKYNIDRMMMSLKRSGKLDNLAGLIVGGFTATKENLEDSFDLPVEEIILEKVKEYNYPVSFHFPAGHLKENRALKFGVAYDYSVGDTEVVLNEKLHIFSLKDFNTSDSLLAKVDS